MSSSKFKICVAGAVDAISCGLDELQKAEIIGKQIAKNGGTLITSASSGFPLFALNGAREAGATTIMFSPAGSSSEHREVYKLSSEVADVVIYTGFGYFGSEIMMTKSADAVIIGCGNKNSIHEFTLAYEEGKPVGVLEGPWEIDDVIKKISGKKHRTDRPIVFDKDPKKLVEKIFEILKTRK